jgi:hypothetical protein
VVHATVLKSGVSSRNFLKSRAISFFLSTACAAGATFSWVDACASMSSNRCAKPSSRCKKSRMATRIASERLGYRPRSCKTCNAFTWGSDKLIVIIFILTSTHTHDLSNFLSTYQSPEASNATRCNYRAAMGNKISSTNNLKVSTKSLGLSSIKTILKKCQRVLGMSAICSFCLNIRPAWLKGGRLYPMPVNIRPRDCIAG